MARKIRVLLAKPDRDGRDRDAGAVARSLRDAGMEVIYIGSSRTPEQIAGAAIQESADIIGLFCLTGRPNALFPRVVEALVRQGAGKVPVFVAGIIPVDDIFRLKKAGVGEIFRIGEPPEEIIKYIVENIGR